MATPKRKRGRPANHGQVDESGRSGRRLSIDIDPTIRATMDDYLRQFFSEQRVNLSMTQVVEKALIDLFDKAGVWPPKPKDGQAGD